METTKQMKKVEGLEEIRQSEVGAVYGGKSISDRVKDQMIVCCVNIPPMY